MGEIIVVEIGPVLGPLGPQQGRDDVIAADEQQHDQHRGEVERDLVLRLVDVEPEGREQAEHDKDQQREEEADALRVFGGRGIGEPRNPAARAQLEHRGVPAQRLGHRQPEQQREPLEQEIETRHPSRPPPRDLSREARASASRRMTGVSGG